MRILSIENAEVEVTGTNADDTGNLGYDLGTQRLIMNVVFQYDSDPQELDTPSGTWWIWPLRQGQVQLQAVLPPGSVPPEIEATPVNKKIKIKADDLDGVSQEVVIENCYMNSFTAKAAQLGEDKTALELTVSYQVFLDDDGKTGDWAPA
jgi:hypothetical protein